MDEFMRAGYKVFPDGTIINRYGKTLKPCDNGLGYQLVRVRINQKQKHFLIHRLVAHFYIGPCPEGCEVDHIDRNRANNDVSNLQYLTHRENLARRPCRSQ